MEFSELYQKVEQALEDVANGKARYDAARSIVDAVNTTLTSMPTQYASVNTEVNAGATANPTNAGWTNLKSIKDHALADRNQFKNMATAIQTAYNKIDEFDAATVQAALDAIV